MCIGSVFSPPRPRRRPTPERRHIWLAPQYSPPPPPRTHNILTSAALIVAATALTPPVAHAQHKPMISAERVAHGPAGASASRIAVRDPVSGRIVESIYSDRTGRLIQRRFYNPPPTPDLNRDGVVDTRDLADLTARLGARPTAPDFDPADLNSDGVVDSADLLILLNALGDAIEPPAVDMPAASLVGGGCLQQCPDGEVISCDSLCGMGTGPGGGVDGLGTGGGGDPDCSEFDNPDDCERSRRGGGGGGGNNGGNDDPPPPPPPTPGGECTISLQPMPGKPPLRAVGIWVPRMNNDDTTDDWDDLPTVQVVGAPAGGTFTWTWSQDGGGALKIGLASPTYNGGGSTTARPLPTDREARILGHLPSEELNDVEIKVVWRSDDGATECEAMLEITVILATLTLRSEGVWSPGNNAEQQPLQGDPNLGRITPLNTPGAGGYFQGVEVVARIEPCIEGIGSSLQFMQHKQGWALRRTGTGINLVAHLESCDPGPSGDSWCDDSPMLASQDIGVNTADNCNVYMVDSPGIITGGGACVGADAGMTNLLCMRFRTWLTADGYRLSDVPARWWVKREIKCDFGVWLTQSEYYGNAFGSSQGVACSLPGAAAPILGGPLPPGAQQRQYLQEQITRLKSDNPASRANAGMEIMRAIDSDELPADRITEISTELIIILQNQQPTTEFESAELWAVRLLGRTGTPAGIAVLLDKINTEYPRFVTAATRATPAVRALIEIGLPAVGPILDRCGAATPKDWAAMTTALRQIDRNSPLVRHAMRAVLDTQAAFARNEAEGATPAANEQELARRSLVKQRLEKFLDSPEPERPEPIVTTNK